MLQQQLVLGNMHQDYSIDIAKKYKTLSGMVMLAMLELDQQKTSTTNKAIIHISRHLSHSICFGIVSISLLHHLSAKIMYQ